MSFGSKVSRFADCGRNLRQLCTAASSSSKLTTVSIDPNTAIATLTLNRPPANALSRDLMQQVRLSLNELEQSKCRGVILTSSNDRIFCAGLDLKEVYASDAEYLTGFWNALQNMWRTLFGTALPTVALMNGHALAGGCMLATCCDYRVILPNFMIGLNETRAGVAVPKWVINSYVNVMPSKRRAEADLIAGNVYKSEEALQAGLVDAVAADKDQALELSKKFLMSYNEGNRHARAQTKLQFRSSILKAFEEDRERDMDLFLQGIKREEVRKHLGEYLEKLKSKKAAKQEEKK